MDIIDIARVGLGLGLGLVMTLIGFVSFVLFCSFSFCCCCVIRHRRPSQSREVCGVSSSSCGSANVIQCMEGRRSGYSPLFSLFSFIVLILIIIDCFHRFHWFDCVMMSLIYRCIGVLV